MKIGDTVRILHRDGRDTDYSFYYTDRMEEMYAGKTAKIISIEKGFGHKGSIPDDGQLYRLDIDKGDWQWASSMLELVEEPVKRYKEDVKDVISEMRKVLEVKDDQRYELNFNL